jgi:hypothetical protein
MGHWMMKLGVILIVVVGLLANVACAKVAALQKLMPQRQTTQDQSPQASVQTQSQRQDAASVGENCREELRRLCYGTSPSSGSVQHCIAASREKFSAQCRAIYQQQLGR